jgi:hypothetical protein
MATTSTFAEFGISKLRLDKQKMTALSAKARRLGLSPARYAKKLIEQDLITESSAVPATLAEIMAPVRNQFQESGMTEQDLDAMVNAARSRRRRRAAGKK